MDLEEASPFAVACKIHWHCHREGGPGCFRMVVPVSLPWVVKSVIYKPVVASLL